MRHGFIKVAAVTPSMRVADCDFNGDNIIKDMKKCDEMGVKIAVFPELAITGYTCGDLFFQDRLLEETKRVLKEIIAANKDLDVLTFVGLPLEVRGKLLNAAAVMKDGKLLGVIPKRNMPNYVEHYEARYFMEGLEGYECVDLGEGLGEVPVGTKLMFECAEMKNLKVAGEICEDLWVPIPESNHHALAGATVLVNLSASVEFTGKNIYRRTLVKGQSARLIAGYVYAASGEGESSTDCVFSGHNMICENGILLAEKKMFEDGMIVSEIDLDKLIHERMRVNTFKLREDKNYHKIKFSIKEEKKMIPLTRKITKSPFLPEKKEEREVCFEEIIKIQVMSLKKRLEHTGTKNVVIGISGGLDSTLALLSTCKTFEMMGMDRTQIHAITMPCFGTTDRTYKNAMDLSNELGVSLKEINIKEAVTVHLRDIEHDVSLHDVTYENAQARERTQVLMDYANKVGGLVLGTGDMSELALGWATYNGDHMSMYGLNASIPKTVVRYLVLHYAELAEVEGKEELAEILFDILDTPVSPELLPPDQEGKITQKTEDVVGPYELHDFFLYYMLRCGYAPDKIYRLANVAFLGIYEEKFIHKWLKKFYQRFFASQYKRSCVPDGPKVGSVGLSPRGDLRLPSDACVDIWMKMMDEIEPR